MWHPLKGGANRRAGLRRKTAAMPHFISLVMVLVLAAIVADIPQPTAMAEPPTYNVIWSDQSNSTTTLILPYTKEEAARAASLLNILAGASAFVGAICPATCGKSALLLSGAAWLASGVASHVALDPDNKDFTHIALPKLPDINLDDFPPAAQKLVGKLAEATALLQAIYQTANRAGAAAQVESEEWVRQQLAALQKYKSQLQVVLDDLQKEFLSYAPLDNSWIKSTIDSLMSYEDQSAIFYKKFREDIEQFGATAN